MQQNVRTYSLRPKKKVILGFKFCPKKHVILFYLESACTCKNHFIPRVRGSRGGSAPAQEQQAASTQQQAAVRGGSRLQRPQHRATEQAGLVAATHT